VRVCAPACSAPTVVLPRIEASPISARRIGTESLGSTQVLAGCWPSQAVKDCCWTPKTLLQGRGFPPPLTPQNEADDRLARMANVWRPERGGVEITLDDHAVAPETPAGGGQFVGSPFWVMPTPLAVTEWAVDPGVNQTIAHTVTPQ